MVPVLHAEQINSWNNACQPWRNGMAVIKKSHLTVWVLQEPKNTTGTTRHKATIPVICSQFNFLATNIDSSKKPTNNIHSVKTQAN